MTVHEAIEVLNIVVQEITKKDVKSAYRKLIFIWHPDRHTGDENVKRATTIAQRLNLAYEVISDSLDYCGFIVNPTKTNSKSHEDDCRQHQYNRTPSAPRASRSKSEGSSTRRRFWRDTVEHGFPDEAVFEVFFESSHLVSAGYESITRTLYQKFRRGTGSIVVYRYYDVPLNVWNELLAASSHGSYAYWNINYSFRYELCSEANRPYNAKWRFSAGNQAQQLYQNT